MSESFDDPIAYFGQWFDEATRHKDIAEPNVMNLATASCEGAPSNRMVLLKDYNQKGFVFYTNLESRKGEHLRENPHASLCFYWEALSKQVRIEGNVVAVSQKEADAYFASRPLKSRVGAWASMQSQPLDHPKTLLKEIAKQTARFVTGDVPRPPYWSGFCLVPNRIEFWQKGEYRIHERLCFTCDADGTWQKQLLYP